MARCPHCRRPVTGSLHKHLSACPLNTIFLAQRATKRVTPTRTSVKKKSLLQVINTSGGTVRLLGDTHFASASAPSKHLCSLISTRDRAAKVLADKYAAKQSLLDDNFCMEEDRWSSFDNHGSYFDNRSVSNLPKPADQSNDDETDAAFMRQFLPHIDPNADDPFDPSKFDKERMEYVKPRTTFSGALPHNLLDQIDLFRILLRAGCSLSMYDKIL